ncbi:ethanolamine utilization protein EutQ [Streptomyces sp. 846.5]|nr:cupin domain-containing protein [Streptomyces sp. 846.5]TDU02150.1 ethanolamine utilization protein EutQ [Streptomyces sp. 846.5]
MDAENGPIRKVEGGFENLPSMNVEGCEAFIGDVHQNPGGSVLCSGFFELIASAPLVYEYTYDEMKIVIEGEFTLTDQATGQVVHAKPRDVLFFPKGTTVVFETPDRALGFYTGHRSFAP